MGYVGPRQAAPLLLDGLRRLEYRGYDSAGIAVTNGAIHVRKAEGKIDRLASLHFAARAPVDATIAPFPSTNSTSKLVPVNARKDCSSAAPGHSQRTSPRAGR